MSTVSSVMTGTNSVAPGQVRQMVRIDVDLVLEDFIICNPCWLGTARNLRTRRANVHKLNDKGGGCRG